jgi:hypothetical protein
MLQLHQIYFFLLQTFFNYPGRIWYNTVIYPIYYTYTKHNGRKEMLNVRSFNLETLTKVRTLKTWKQMEGCNKKLLWSPTTLLLRFGTFLFILVSKRDAAAQGGMFSRTSLKFRKNLWPFCTRSKNISTTGSSGKWPKRRTRCINSSWD